MADIKIKKRSAVRTLDKTINNSIRIKNKILSTKDTIENVSNNENENQIEYASNKITNTTNLITNKTINDFYIYGKRAFKETTKNIDNGIERAKAFKNKVAKNKEKEVIKNNFDKSKSSIKPKTLSLIHI